MSIKDSTLAMINSLNGLKTLLWTTILVSLFSGFASQFVTSEIGPQEVLGLSRTGLMHGFIWQPLTYLFIQPPDRGVSFLFLLNLSFNLYMLWVIGKSLLQVISSKEFLRLFLLCGIGAGLIGLSLLFWTHSPLLLAGPSPAIYAIAFVWTMLFPDLRVLLFLTLPIKAKWLILAFLGLAFLADLPDGNFVTTSMVLSATLIGYLYGVIHLKLNSPFSWMRPVDRLILQQGRALFNSTRDLIKSTRSPFSVKKKAQIIDIKTGLVKPKKSELDL